MAPVQLRAATESWEGEARKEPNLLHTLSSAVVPHWGETPFWSCQRYRLPGRIGTQEFSCFSPCRRENDMHIEASPDSKPAIFIKENKLLFEAGLL